MRILPLIRLYHICTPDVKMKLPKFSNLANIFSLLFHGVQERLEKRGSTIFSSFYEYKLLFHHPCWSDTFDAVSWTTNAIRKNDVI